MAKVANDEDLSRDGLLAQSGGGKRGKSAQVGSPQKADDAQEIDEDDIEDLEEDDDIDEDDEDFDEDDDELEDDDDDEEEVTPKRTR